MSLTSRIWPALWRASFRAPRRRRSSDRANPNIGPPFLLPAFAAAYLGATAFRINTFNVPGTIVAVFTVAVGITGLQLFGVEFFIAPIFQGVSLILAVIAVRYLRRERLVA